MAESYLAGGDGEFMAFVDGNGGTYLKSVDFFATMPDGVRGVVATAKINKNATVLHVPFTVCIHGGPEGSEVGAAIAAQPTEVDPFVKTVLATHFELSNGGNSRFAAWVRMLPTEVRLPMVGATSDETLRALAGSAVGPVVCSGKELEMLEESVRPMLKAIAADASGTLRVREWAGGVGSDEFCALYLRCYALVASRSFGSPKFECPLMCPLQDQLNHSSDERQRNVELDCTPGAFEVRATRAIAPGEQLLFSYGDYSDAELLAAFGFVEKMHGFGASAATQATCRPNVLNWVPVGDVVLEALEGHAKRHGGRAMSPASIVARTAALEGAGLLGDMRVTADEPLPLSLWTAAQVFFMDDAPFAAWKKQCNEIMAAHLLPPEDLGGGESATFILQALLAVADAAIAARAQSADAVKREGAGGGGDDSYIWKATLWVLGQEAVLLANMRKMAMMHITQLGGSEGMEEDA